MNFINFIPEFKQVLTRDGWVEIGDYYDGIKKSPLEVLVIYKNKCVYVCPKSFNQSFYQGVLIELITDTSRVILKPSNIIEGKKIKEFRTGDRLSSYFMFQTIEKINRVLWEGNQYSLFFGKNVLLPIKFENDYILLPS